MLVFCQPGEKRATVNNLSITMDTAVSDGTIEWSYRQHGRCYTLTNTSFITNMRQLLVGKLDAEGALGCKLSDNNVVNDTFSKHVIGWNGDFK